MFSAIFGAAQRAQAGQGNVSGPQQTLASFLQSLGDNHSIVPGEGW